MDSELIARNGPPKIPSSFPYDSEMMLKEATLTVRHFPEIDWFEVNPNMYYLVSLAVCLIYTAHHSSIMCRNLC